MDEAKQNKSTALVQNNMCGRPFLQISLLTLLLCAYSM